LSARVSRRDLFARFFRPRRKEYTSTQPAAHPVGSGTATPAAPNQTQDRVAVIQGRFCIALTSFCSVCVEHCPVPGAMKRERGMPIVVPDVCTGCGVCHDVCPAPRNAVLMLPKRRPVQLPSR
jgi:Na+-translocating ferredoxin:NAD+ oxidoreductase RNF subunit RnfB